MPIASLNSPSPHKISERKLVKEKLQESSNKEATGFGKELKQIKFKDAMGLGGSARSLPLLEDQRIQCLTSPDPSPKTRTHGESKKLQFNVNNKLLNSFLPKLGRGIHSSSKSLSKIIESEPPFEHITSENKSP